MTNEIDVEELAVDEKESLMTEEDEQHNSVTEELCAIFGDFSDYIDQFLFEIVTFLAVVNSFITLVYDILRLFGLGGWKMGMLPCMPFTISLALFIFGAKKRKNKRNSKAMDFIPSGDEEGMEDMNKEDDSENGSSSNIKQDTKDGSHIAKVQEVNANGKPKGILREQGAGNLLGGLKDNANKTMKMGGDTTVKFSEGIPLEAPGQLTQTMSAGTKDMIGGAEMNQATDKVMKGANFLNARRKRLRERQQKPSLAQIYRRLGRLILRVVCRRKPAPGNGDQTKDLINGTAEVKSSDIRKISRILSLIKRRRKNGEENSKEKSTGNNELSIQENQTIEFEQVSTQGDQNSEGEKLAMENDRLSQESGEFELQEAIDVHFDALSNFTSGTVDICSKPPILLHKTGSSAVQMIVDSVPSDNTDSGSSNEANKANIHDHMLNVDSLSDNTDTRESTLHDAQTDCIDEYRGVMASTKSPGNADAQRSTHVQKLNVNSLSRETSGTRERTLHDAQTEFIDEHRVMVNTKSPGNADAQSSTHVQTLTADSLSSGKSDAENSTINYADKDFTDEEMTMVDPVSRATGVNTHIIGHNVNKDEREEENYISLNMENIKSSVEIHISPSGLLAHESTQISMVTQGGLNVMVAQNTPNQWNQGTQSVLAAQVITNVPQENPKYTARFAKNTSHDAIGNAHKKEVGPCDPINYPINHPINPNPLNTRNSSSEGHTVNDISFTLPGHSKSPMYTSLEILEASMDI